MGLTLNLYLKSSSSQVWNYHKNSGTQAYMQSNYSHSTKLPPAERELYRCYWRIMVNADILRAGVVGPVYKQLRSSSTAIKNNKTTTQPLYSLINLKAFDA